jgi:RecB family endonuclease NucS
MKLGKICYVDDLRTVWKHEEKEFTPWLAENISLLGEALGLDLEVISVEHNVGSFSLDILAKDTSDGRIVAIENQLEITDHTHLGQILTYASGVDAEVIVWITGLGR